MKKYILILIAAVSITSAHAQVSTNDELKTLVNAALSYQPRIKQAEQNVNLNNVKVDIARTAYMPNVGVDASYTYIDPRNSVTFAFPGAPPKVLFFAPHDNYDAHLGVSWNVWDFGKTKADIEKAKAGLQEAKNNVEAARAAYAYQVAKVYYAIIYFKQAITVNDDEISTLEDNKKIIIARIDNGDATDFDRLSMDVRLNTAKNKKSDLENMVQQYTILLQSLTGTAPKITNNKIDVTATPVSLTQGVASTNWDVVAAKDKKAIAEADSRSYSKYMYPRLNLFGNAGYKDGYFIDNNLNKLYLNEAAGAGISWNLFSGNRNKKTYELSKMAMQIATLEQQNAELNTQRDLSVNASDINTLIDKYNTMPTQVQQAKDALTLAQSRYKNGVIRELELIDAQNNLKETQLQQLQYEYQLCVAQLEHNRLMGVKFW